MQSRTAARGTSTKAEVRRAPHPRQVCKVRIADTARQARDFLGQVPAALS